MKNSTKKLVLAALFVYKYAGFVYRVFTGRALALVILIPIASIRIPFPGLFFRAGGFLFCSIIFLLPVAFTRVFFRSIPFPGFLRLVRLFWALRTLTTIFFPRLSRLRIGVISLMPIGLLLAGFLILFRLLPFVSLSLIFRLRPILLTFLDFFLV